MKRMYDVDVYLTHSKYKYDNKQYDINILVFPSKLLKSSPEFSEKYYNFLSRKEEEILTDIFNAFRYLGIDNKEIQNDYFNTVLSSNIPDYLKNYNEELISNINDFMESKNIIDGKLSDHISNVRINRIEVSFPHRSYTPVSYIDLRLSFDSSNKFLTFNSFLNDNVFRKLLIDYLNTKMKLDPQITFWFE